MEGIDGIAAYTNEYRIFGDISVGLAVWEFPRARWLGLPHGFLDGACAGQTGFSCLHPSG